jgi:uncharacterized repeat protein (TIGR01451 family)
MNQTDKTVRRRLGRVVCAGVAATITAFAGLSVAASPPASAGDLLNETFKDATVTPNTWMMRSPKGTHVPCLTAARYPAPEDSLPACNTVKAGAAPEANPGNNTDDPTGIPVEPQKPAAKGPNLAVPIDGQGNFAPGGTGMLTATVSNNKEAGPTTSAVTLTIPVPDGVKVTTVTGYGWYCKATDQAVICSRPGTGGDALQPGATYPAANVNTVTDPDGPTSVSVSAKVDIDGDTDPSDNVAGPLTLPKPGLQVGMTIKPNPYSPGGKLTYTITVTNTGPKQADNVKLTGAVANVGRDVPWTCAASEGSTCPAESGTGKIATAISVAPGGTVTFTADCEIPEGVAVPLTGSATIVSLPPDPNCTKGCTVTATSTAAQ